MTTSRTAMTIKTGADLRLMDEAGRVVEDTLRAANC